MTPSTAIQRPDLGMALEEYDLEMSRQGFIADKVFPVIDVQLATSNFSRVKLKSLLVDRDTNRAPGGNYSRGSGEFEQDQYTTSEQGHEEVNDDSEQAIYSYTIDSEAIVARRAQDVVLRNYEKRVATKAFDTAVWTGAALTTAVATPWSTYASATPINDVEGAIRKVYDGFGVRPNALVLPWKNFRDLRLCAQIIDRIKYSGRDDPKNVTARMLAELFDIEEVIVADAQYNSANEGQNASLTAVWTTGRAQVCRVAKTKDIREVCIGRTFHFTKDGSKMGGTIEQYREEKVRGDVFRCRHHTGEKVINKETGHLLTGL
jgi:hypothetical protein